MWKKFIPVLLALALVSVACASAETETTEAIDEPATTEAPEETTTTTEAMEEEMEETTVVDVALSSPDFSTLVAAVQAAGLVETLQGEGPFTVLAPTNAAFDAAFDALGITAEELLADTDTLTAILTYHVLPLEADAATVISLDGQSVETVNGESVAISVVDGTVMVDDATVTTTDLEADNGVVHVIDSVLLPAAVADALGAAMSDEATIVDVAVDSGDFPTLVAALQATGLDEVLSGEGPFTVFAPTEEAFAALLAALDMTAEELLADTELLTAVLTYHVVGVDAPAAVVVTLDGQDVETVNGATVLVTVSDAGVMVNEANVITTDVFGSNGVIHVIDAVLLPPAE